MLKNTISEIAPDGNCVNNVRPWRLMSGEHAAEVPDSNKEQEMDRETLIGAIKDGPIKVTINDGSIYVIPSPEFAIVDKRAAHILTKGDDGEMRARILSLVCMVSVEKLELTP